MVWAKRINSSNIQLGIESLMLSNLSLGRLPDAAVRHFRKLELRLPTFAELAEPWKISPAIRNHLAAVDSASPDPLNLYRMHWYNDANRRGIAPVPEYMEIPSRCSGVAARIVVLLGDLFPLIGAHKVLAAYGCLIPRLLTGEFDPSRHRAVWPSTGNYCRGGIAISRILGCHGVAVLPAGMSKERFDWLEKWVLSPSDIVRTPGTESNVKEIYDQCAVLSRDDRNVILNQFSEFGNYAVHYLCTGMAAAHVYRNLQADNPNLRLSAFVAGTGSAGTLGAGDYLKDQFRTKIVAVEASECPTLLCNGFGEHNIQGIGDKHIPLIHNVMNTDSVVSISDQSSDGLFSLFNSEIGRSYLQTRKGFSGGDVDNLARLGLSGIANMLAAIKYARAFDLTAEDVIVTVATDNASLYKSQIAESHSNRRPQLSDQVDAAEIFGKHFHAMDASQLLELSYLERKRIFNLGYYTWVEQQGLSQSEFESRRDQKYWQAIRAQLSQWDTLIGEFNNAIGF